MGGVVRQRAGQIEWRWLAIIFRRGFLTAYRERPCQLAWATNKKATAVKPWPLLRLEFWLASYQDSELMNVPLLSPAMRSALLGGP